jgi:hypothetical protein
MKRALQAILIAGRKMEEDVRYNRKKITIREGHRDYTEGPVMIGCHYLDWCVMRNITSVRHTILGEVAPFEYEADGFYDQIGLKSGLQQFYPNIDWDSPVTVIRFE